MKQGIRSPVENLWITCGRRWITMVFEVVYVELFRKGARIIHREKGGYQHLFQRLRTWRLPGQMSIDEASREGYTEAFGWRPDLLFAGAVRDRFSVSYAVRE